MPVFEPEPLELILNDAINRCSLRFLTPRQIFMLDAALASLGEWGEVRLVVSKGNLRFVVMERSYDAYKWHPGDGFDGDEHSK